MQHLTQPNFGRSIHVAVLALQHFHHHIYAARAACAPQHLRCFACAAALQVDGESGTTWRASANADHDTSGREPVRAGGRAGGRGVGWGTVF